MSEPTLLDLARAEPWNYGGALLAMHDALAAQLAAAERELEEMRETRARELRYVMEACKAASLARATHESRDALLDLRAWATNRIDAALERKP